MNTNLPFEACWTLDFVKRLQRYYLEDSWAIYFCQVSFEFKMLWQTRKHRKRLKELANKFNPDHPVSELDSRLFYFDTSRLSDNRAIRIAFLEHEIQRLSNHELPNLPN